MTFEREKNATNQNPFRLFRQYLSFSYGGICYAGKNQTSPFATQNPHCQRRHFRLARR